MLKECCSKYWHISFNITLLYYFRIRPEHDSTFKVHLLSANNSDSASPTHSIASPHSFSTQQSSIPLSTLTSNNAGAPVLTNNETVA